MKQILGLTFVFALAFTMFTANAQDNTKSCSDKAKVECASKAKAMKASNEKSGCCASKAKAMKASNKEGCCSSKAKAMKASNSHDGCEGKDASKCASKAKNTKHAGDMKAEGVKSASVGMKVENE